MSTTGASSTGGGTVLANPQIIRPKKLLDAISNIQEMSAWEGKSTTELPKNLFTWRNRLDYMEVGGLTAITTTLISAATTPLTIGVLDKIVPVFGTSNPSLYDQCFVFVLALATPIAYAMLLASLHNYYSGTISKQMISALLSGIRLGGLITMFLIFALFHALYTSILRPDRVDKWLAALVRWKAASVPTALKAYAWIMDFKQVFLIASVFLFVSTMLVVIVPPIVIKLKESEQKDVLPF